MLELVVVLVELGRREPLVERLRRRSTTVNVGENQEQSLAELRLSQRFSKRTTTTSGTRLKRAGSVV